MLGQPVTSQDESDQRHLVNARASNAMTFVTQNPSCSRRLTRVHGVRSFGSSPADLVSRFEELRNEKSTSGNAWEEAA